MVEQLTDNQFIRVRFPVSAPIYSEVMNLYLIFSDKLDTYMYDI